MRNDLRASPALDVTKSRPRLRSSKTLARARLPSSAWICLIIASGFRKSSSEKTWLTLVLGTLGALPVTPKEGALTCHLRDSFTSLLENWLSCFKAAERSEEHTSE